MNCDLSLSSVRLSNLPPSPLLLSSLPIVIVLQLIPTKKVPRNEVGAIVHAVANRGPLNFPPLNFAPPNCRPPTTANSDLTRRGNLLLDSIDSLSKLSPPNIPPPQLLPPPKDSFNSFWQIFRFVHIKIRGKLFYCFESLARMKGFLPPQTLVPPSTKLTPHWKCEAK